MVACQVLECFEPLLLGFVCPTGPCEPRVPSRARQPVRGAGLSKETLRSGRGFGERSGNDFSSADEDNDGNYSEAVRDKGQVSGVPIGVHLQWSLSARSAWRKQCQPKSKECRC